MLNLIVDSSKKTGKAYVEKGRIFEYTEDDIIHQHKKCQTQILIRSKNILLYLWMKEKKIIRL